MAISASLHWVVSQSIFLVRIDTYKQGITYKHGKITSESVTSQVGYSCPPILTAILIGAALMLFAIAMGAKRLNGELPVAGSCSAAISAACHRPTDDIDAAFMPVQWGAVSSDEADDIGHCCFTSRVVESVVSGRTYAGTVRSGS